MGLKLTAKAGEKYTIKAKGCDSVLNINVVFIRQGVVKLDFDGNLDYTVGRPEKAKQERNIIKNYYKE